MLAVLAKVVPANPVVDAIGTFGDNGVVQDDVQVSN